MLFFFNDTATTEIYTLSLHDALPIFDVLRDDIVRLKISRGGGFDEQPTFAVAADLDAARADFAVEQSEAAVLVRTAQRSEEHTSELQSRQYLVCRLLLEKKKKTTPHI